MFECGLALCFLFLVVALFIAILDERFMIVVFLFLAAISFTVAIKNDIPVRFKNALLTEDVYRNVPLKGDVAITKEVKINFHHGTLTTIERVDSIVVEKIPEK